jgi:hypothetical protein
MAVAAARCAVGIKGPGEEKLMSSRDEKKPRRPKRPAFTRWPDKPTRAEEKLDEIETALRELNY